MKMNKFKKVLSVMLVFIALFTLFPTLDVSASNVIVTGGHTLKENAYSWGFYSSANSISVDLPANETDFWVKYTLPSNKRVYASSSYSVENAGMSLEMRNSTDSIIDSSRTVLNMTPLTQFIAVRCDNLSSTSQTYYIHVNRGSCTGRMIFTLSMDERIKKGRGEFTFSGSSINTGNRAVSTAGVNSTILSLNLTNNTTIPPQAIVTLVRTSGTQSPNQGGVHHMIYPSTQGATQGLPWYTSIVTDSTGGTFNVSASDNIQARQLWQFRYNALATAKSTMSNVKLTLEWEYDIANTSYKTY